MASVHDGCFHWLSFQLVQGVAQRLVEGFRREGFQLFFHELMIEVVFLHAGRIVEHAPADAFFAAPQSREAQAFLKGDLLW